MGWTPEELAAMAEADAEIERNFVMTLSERRACNTREPKKERSKKALASARWYANNRDAVLAKNKAYYYDHRETILARRRKAYQENKEEKREYSRAYYHEHADELRAKARAKYHARKEAERAQMDAGGDCGNG